ncbi:hypothetical protein CPB83DRAFT_788008 [Crepidotus variabilis]|uniref:Uncharacterized protein n=1 Tax=Crepidotus variabilis TaxID=179855 RepID=A0A9P6EIW5_9AGAR|nr:hypothetical protein CPB83DRAFT_788008 [Crepidotus variabilis]
MAIGEFSLRLQEGIVGGFAPPTINAFHTITKPQNNNQLMISSAFRSDGEPEPKPLAPKSINSQDAHTTALVEELHGILKTLPTEQPPGSEDIYGLDTSIAWGSEDFEWMNGGPQGCGGGESFVKASPEDKTKFKRAVAIVKELTNKDA